MSSNSLKIVHVIPSLQKGGAERLVLNISEQLVLLGHTVHIIVFREGNEYLDLSSGINIEVIPSQVLYSLTGKDITETEAFDARIREIQPDIIHSHLLESEFVSRFNPLEGTTYVTHWHGCHPPTNSKKFKDYFSKDSWWSINSINQLKRQYKHCNNHFLCISNFIELYVKRAFNPNDENVTVILNGTDLSKFKFESVERDKEVFTMVTVGSFNTYKNQIFLLKVIKALKELGLVNFKLQLLGDGIERKNLESYSKNNSLGNMVEFFGYVDNPGHYMNRAHALVHSAIDEPFGLILLEAMSCKTPVVAFQSGGIPEIVLNGKTGLLTGVNDVSAFVQALTQLNSNSSLIKELGEAGQKAVQEFAIDKYVKRIENLYFDLLKTKQD
ncbi:MAG: glycosyltransferase involved in cell wall biosynthesis [Bacteroidia bacterium]|jgi:glycosyltransferase involved in cell wall biosynthesis